MTSTILVRGARQLLTLRGPAEPRRGYAMNDLAVIEDGAVLIRDGVIVCVGPSRRLENLAEARHAREIDAAGRVVMPGFVDSHTHLVCGPPRLDEYELRVAGASYDEIVRSGGGIFSSVRAVRAASTRRLELQARHVLRRFIRHGTTTLGAKSGYGLDETGELRILRATAVLDGDPLDVIPSYFGAHAVPPEFAGRADDYIEWICSYLMPLIRKRRLARLVDIQCEQGGFTIEQARRYLYYARELGFLPRVHTDQYSNSGAVRLAVELGAVSADHLERIGPDDILVLADSTTIATLMPGVTFHLGLGRFAPGRALIDAGAAVALATDFNPGTSPTCNMQMILSLACSRMHMTPAEAITAATLNGAHALGCGERLGSLEPGKQADLVFFDAKDYREIPYHFGVNLAATVMKRGQVLYRQGEVRWDED